MAPRTEGAGVEKIDMAEARRRAAQAPGSPGPDDEYGQIKSYMGEESIIRAAYLVLYPTGGLGLTTTNRELTERRAEEVEGLLVTLPVIADFRRKRVAG